MRICCVRFKQDVRRLSAGYKFVQHIRAYFTKFQCNLVRIQKWFFYLSRRSVNNKIKITAIRDSPHPVISIMFYLGQVTNNYIYQFKVL